MYRIFQWSLFYRVVYLVLGSAVINVEFCGNVQFIVIWFRVYHHGVKRKRPLA